MADENKVKIAVLVSGRGSNLQSIIDSVERGDVSADIALILSNKANALALERGRKHGIESVFLDPKRYPDKLHYDKAMIDILKKQSVELVCLAGFMRILSREFIQAYQGKIINIHPSLLPSFPGLDPQKKALEHGVKFSGCTVHFVEEAVDAGPIILQAVVPVLPTDTVETLSQRILEQEHITYPKAIQLYIQNKLIYAGRRVTCRND
jgi:phosphoribosylglycinamide formyltransferase-1